jgi:hypothetical protein
MTVLPVFMSKGKFVQILETLSKTAHQKPPYQRLKLSSHEPSHAKVLTEGGDKCEAQVFIPLFVSHSCFSASLGCITDTLIRDVLSLTIWSLAEGLDQAN